MTALEYAAVSALISVPILAGVQFTGFRIWAILDVLVQAFN